MSSLKVIVLGDVGVGKTCVLNQLVNKEFCAQYKSTMGVNFYSKEMYAGHSLLKLQIWDISGSERFLALGNAYYRTADACIIVFDVTDQTSFSSLSEWKKTFLYHSMLQNPENFPFFVLGNKIDLGKQEVSSEYVRKWCTDHNSKYYEVSAKDNLLIENIFHAISQDIVHLTEQHDGQSNCCIDLSFFPKKSVSSPLKKKRRVSLEFSET